VDPITRLQASVDQTRLIVAATSVDQFGSSTPCPDWDVRALINHTLGALTMFRDVGSKGEADMGVFGQDLVGTDAAASFDDVAAATLAAWRAEGRMARPAKMPWGEMPADVALQILANDVLVHGWDLAKATGQRVAWGQGLAEETLNFARAMFTPELKGDDFAAEVAVAPGADAMARLVAFEGREP